eukprot:376092-Alexandrium_andersonii.AAC.2
MQAEPKGVIPKVWKRGPEDAGVINPSLSKKSKATRVWAKPALSASNSHLSSNDRNTGCKADTPCKGTFSSREGGNLQLSSDVFSCAKTVSRAEHGRLLRLHT